MTHGMHTISTQYQADHRTYKAKGALHSDIRKVDTKVPRRSSHLKGRHQNTRTRTHTQ